jgi:hypothetical protein
MFGGNSEDAEVYVRAQPAYRPLEDGVSVSVHLRNFEQGCSRASTSSARLDELFHALPRDQYALIRQRTPAWLELRRRIPVTASQLWPLLMLPVQPARGRSGFRKPDFAMPAYLTGEKPCACYESTLTLVLAVREHFA